MRVAVVAGDVTVDWNIADTSPASTSPGWSGDQFTAISCQPGGACVLGELIDRTGVADVRRIEVPRSVMPGDRSYHHSTAAWARMPVERGSDDVVWRLRDYLGLALAADGALTPPSVENDDAGAALVVLDDADLGCRKAPERWPAAVTEQDTEPWVLWKASQPVASGKLFEFLIDRHADRLIVLTTASDLRRTGVEVSRALSWESSVDDLERAFVSGPVAAITRAAHVVVGFGAAGAYIWSRDQTARLVFDMGEVEGTWEAKRPGGMIGATTCLAAGIATEWLRSDQPDIEAGTLRGLGALRTLYDIGYLDPSTPGGTAIEFPLDVVASELLEDPRGFHVVDVNRDVAAVGGAGDWSFLGARHGHDLTRLSALCVLNGPAALDGVPIGRFGSLVTVDRREIEAMTSIRNLMAEYCMDERPGRPLSIAVFGPPGSGKSFAVTQLARSLHADDVHTLTFNLSQFAGPDELAGALHQVRDAGLSAQMPLVFWDEFDTALEGLTLGWLRHFLAPMQDGEFRDGQILHPIGRAIFVFAGGTATRLDELESVLGGTPEEVRARWRSVKGPDFLSRLRGTVEIMGTDPVEAAGDDPLHRIRRAVVLHSLIARTWPHLETKSADGSRVLAVDDDVLRALLCVSRYRHGVRSMESIVATSRLHGESRFHASALPPQRQILLHVDAEEFFSLLRQADPEADPVLEVSSPELAASGG